MENLVPLGTGNSRLMKSNIPASTTLAQLIQMLNNGTFPYDIGPLNPAGISQQGTPLNKATLFSDDTAALYPEGVNNPNDALEYLRKYGAGATATYPAAIPITAGDVCDVVDGEASASIVAEPGEINNIAETRISNYSLVKLNEDRSVAAYIDTDNNNRIRGMLVDNKTGKGVGSELNLCGWASSYLSLAKIDNERFVFAFCDVSSGTNYGCVNAGQLSGAMVTVGSGIGTTFEESTTYDTCLVPLSNARFLVLCRISDYLRARVGWLNDGVSLSRSAYTNDLNGVTALCIRGILLPDDSSGYYRVLVIFVDNGNNRQLNAVVVSISKTNLNSMPTFGTKTVLEASGVGTDSLSLCLSDDGIIVSYQGNSGIRLMKVSVSGTTITKGQSVGTGVGFGRTCLAENNGTIILGSGNTLSIVDSDTLSVSGTFLFDASANYVNGLVFTGDTSLLASYSASFTLKTQLVQIQNGRLGGKFTTNSTQAIALNSANVGEDVTLLFGGSAPLPGATAGTEIISDGILGEVPIDGMVTALSKGIRNNLTQIYTGSYTGTGTYGRSNPNTLTFPFEPKLVFVILTSAYPIQTSYRLEIAGQFLIPWGISRISASADTDGSGSYVPYLNFTYSGTSLSWYASMSSGSANATHQFNTSGASYSYVAIG